MATKLKFKKEYVLGIGYPWAYGVVNYQRIGLNKLARGVYPHVLDWPKELWSADLPEYELVLRGVKK